MRATARTSLEALQDGTTRPTAIRWFRRGRAEDHSRQAAVVGAFERCAPAMTQTTLIAGLGLLVYVQSHFLPIAQFGLLMFILLLAALVGDLLLLPAILATRLGEGFGRRVKSEE
jgi:predicted RND superfamily exporter protein